MSALTLAASLVLTGCGGSVQHEADVDGRPQAAKVSESDVLTVAVGDCIAADVPVGGVASVPVVPCAEPHESEVFLVHVLPGDVFPGDAAVSAAAQDRCLSAFGDFVGLEYEESELEVSSLEPTQATWDHGDRHLVCVVVEPRGGVTGTLEGARR